MLRPTAILLFVCMLVVGIARADDRETIARALRAAPDATAYLARARQVVSTEAGRLAIRDTFDALVLRHEPPFDAALELAVAAAGGNRGAEHELRSRLEPLADTIARFDRLLGPRASGLTRLERVAEDDFRTRLIDRHAGRLRSTDSALALARGSQHVDVRVVAVVVAGRHATTATGYLAFLDGLHGLGDVSPVSKRAAIRMTLDTFAAGNPTLAQIGTFLEKAEPILGRPPGGPADASGPAPLLGRLAAFGNLDPQIVRPLLRRALDLAPNRDAFLAGLRALEGMANGPYVAAFLEPGLRARNASFEEVMAALRLAARLRSLHHTELVKLALEKAGSRSQMIEAVGVISRFPAVVAEQLRAARERFLALRQDGAASLHELLRHVPHTPVELVPVLRAELERAPNAATFASVAEAARALDHSHPVLTPELVARFLAFRPPPTAGEALSAMQAVAYHEGNLLALANHARSVATSAADLVAIVELLGARRLSAQARFITQNRGALTAFPLTGDQARNLLTAVRDPAEAAALFDAILRRLPPSDYVALLKALPEAHGRVTAVENSILDFFGREPTTKQIAELFTAVPEGLRVKVVDAALGTPGSPRELTVRLEAIASHLPPALRPALGAALDGEGAVNRFLSSHPSIAEINHLNWGSTVTPSNAARERLIEAAIVAHAGSAGLANLRLIPYGQRSAEHQAFLTSAQCTSNGCFPGGVGLCADALRRAKRAFLSALLGR